MDSKGKPLQDQVLMDEKKFDTNNPDDILRLPSPNTTSPTKRSNNSKSNSFFRLSKFIITAVLTYYFVCLVEKLVGFPFPPPDNSLSFLSHETESNGENRPGAHSNNPSSWMGESSEGFGSVLGYLARFGQGIDFSIGDGEVEAARGKKPKKGNEVEEFFLSVPDPERIRKDSHNFTSYSHPAGTPGDVQSSLYVKNKWESFLGLSQTDNKTNIFDAGTEESQNALIKHQLPNGHHRDGTSGCGCSTCRETRTGRPISEELRAMGEFGRWVRKAGRKIGKWMGLRQPHHHHSHHRHYHHRPKSPIVYIDTYYPFLNYPSSPSTPEGKSRSLSLFDPSISPINPSYVAELKEDQVEGDVTSGWGSRNEVVYHGMSSGGEVEGEVVYANFGRKEDFDELVERGIDFKGKIVLVRYGQVFRGLKVSYAEELGAAGVAIFTDPAEDDVVIEPTYQPYPQGPARNPSSVQRGSVQKISIYPGDPLTPFKPAYKNASRLDRESPEMNIPHIPSIPLSYKDAVPFLTSLNGWGEKLAGWEGGLGPHGVEYWSGPSGAKALLKNPMDDKVTPLWNTMAVIPGWVEDEAIVLGNHRDAWIFGAADPNSGSGSVDEIVRGLGLLLQKGWRPLRTLILASWSGEEYGLIGSTEFGEDFRDYLQKNVAAYLNVDVSVSGSYYGISASPSLADLFVNASSQVVYPASNPLSSCSTTNATLLDRLHADTSRRHQPRPQSEIDDNENGDALAVNDLGSGSDFTTFLQHLGIASMDLGFGRGPGDPVYHYHSIYDSAYWMDKFGDPTFDKHAAISKVLGLGAIRLLDSPILPINVTAYAYTLDRYTQRLKSVSKRSSDAFSRLDFESLENAVSGVKKAAEEIGEEIEETTKGLEKLRGWKDRHGRWNREFHRDPTDVEEGSATKARVNPPTRKGHPLAHTYNEVGRYDDEASRRLNPFKLFKHVRSINKRLQAFEGGFISKDGLPKRPWYRHLGVAPGRWLGYGATTFPSVTEAITVDKDRKSAEEELERLVQQLEQVAKTLGSKTE